MDGISISPRPGIVITGQHGKYLLGKKLGRGGNGAVFEASDVNEDATVEEKKKYAVKFFSVRDEAEKGKKELEKRKHRFVKEIKEVLGFQEDVKGVVPIYDTSVSFEQESGELWYIMPMAQMYNPQKYSVLEKLEQVRQIGICIRQLHRMGFAHRDIKPQNLLLLDGQICLSDFGLVWNTNDTDAHITEVNDWIGPQAIRPPELRSIAEIDGVDYRKSDVYLYAKTLWMILKCNKQGFGGKYDRGKSDVYIDKEILNIYTAEPLHCLMENATKDIWYERIDIGDCLEYIESQLKVIKCDIPTKILTDMKYAEQIKHDVLTIASDERRYTKADSMLRILNNMADMAGLFFTDLGKEYTCLPLGNSRHIKDNIFEFEVYNPFQNNQKKQILTALDFICMKKGETYYTLQSVKHSFHDSSAVSFSNIEDAIWDEHKRINLNANYSITHTSQPENGA